VPIVNASVCNLGGVEIEAPPIVRTWRRKRPSESERRAKQKIIQQILEPVQRAFIGATRSAI